MATDSNRVAIGIFASRIAGLVREVFMQAVFGGKSIVVDAFRAAMQIPNLIQNLVGEGALSASFVPVYARLIEDEEDVEARRVASGTLGFLTALVSLLVALIVIAARPIVWIVTPGLPDEAAELAITYTRITAIGTGFVTISAFCLGVLNSHRRFLLSYSAPIAWNGAQIFLLGGLLLFGTVDKGDPESLKKGALWLSYAVVIGSFAQLAVLWPSANRLASGLVPHLRREGQINLVLRRALPAISGRGIVQLAGFVDLALASFLAAGALNGIRATLVFYLLPISLFGFSVAASELTEMSRGSSEMALVHRRVTLGLRKVALPAGIATAVLVVGATSVVGAAYGLFGEGKEPDNLKYLGLVLASFAIGLPASMMARVTQNALYALGDVKGPTRIAAYRLIVVAVAGAFLMFPLDRLVILDGSITQFDSLLAWSPLPDAIREAPAGFHLGAVGLGLGSSIAAAVEWHLLRQRLNARLQTSVSSGLALPITAASLFAASVVGLVQLIGLPNPMAGIAVGIAGLGAYIGALAFQGYHPIHR